jgi:hypothetical protein
LEKAVSEAQSSESQVTELQEWICRVDDLLNDFIEHDTTFECLPHDFQVNFYFTPNKKLCYFSNKPTNTQHTAHINNNNTTDIIHVLFSHKNKFPHSFNRNNFIFSLLPFFLPSSYKHTNENKFSV